MFSRFMKVSRGVCLAIALVALSGAPLWAQASACAQYAVGGQTGKSYKLKSQSLVTETQTVQLSIGGAACGVGGQTGGQLSEQYNVGYYESEDGGPLAKVDCRTGRVLGWA
jgi:hypothetical protein